MAQQPVLEGEGKDRQRAFEAGRALALPGQFEFDPPEAFMRAGEFCLQRHGIAFDVRVALFQREQIGFDQRVAFLQRDDVGIEFDMALGQCNDVAFELDVAPAEGERIGFDLDIARA